LQFLVYNQQKETIYGIHCRSDSFAALYFRARSVLVVARNCSDAVDRIGGLLLGSFLPFGLYHLARNQGAAVKRKRIQEAIKVPNSKDPPNDAPDGAKQTDPTENVIALVKAKDKRQDDLRMANEKYLDERIHCQKEMADLRAEHLKELHHIDSCNNGEMAKLRETHAKELAMAEAGRLNAIRQNDQLSVSTTAVQQKQAIDALAATTAVERETLRTLVSTTAATVASQNDIKFAGLNDKLGKLEQISFTNQGRAGVSDPMMTEMIIELKKLSQSQATGSGKTEGVSATWVFMGSVVVLILGLLAIGAFVFSGRTPSPAAPPQVIYAVPPK